VTTRAPGPADRPAQPAAAATALPAFYYGEAQRPAGMEPVVFATLSPLQRLLLVIDGTVTTALEALAGEAITVASLDQHPRVLVLADADLAAPAGTAVLERRVALTGAASGRRYALAESVILLDRLPGALRVALAAGRVGIGQVLRTPGFDSRREGLWFGRWRQPLPAPFAGPAGDDFLARAYRVLGGGVPVMRITEFFPWDLALP
jgi:chorismate-pyruvate lyase